MHVNEYVRQSTFDVAGEWRSKARLSAIGYLPLDLGHGFVLISKPALGEAQVMRRSQETWNESEHRISNRLSPSQIARPEHNSHASENRREEDQPELHGDETDDQSPEKPGCSVK